MKKPHTFKIGDIVKLKSGGPRMTVSDEDIGNGMVRCQWFAGSRLSWGHFDPHSIEPAPEVDAKK